MSETHVLLKAIQRYAVMRVDDWKQACDNRHSLVDVWHEVARGTEDELEALAKLMPKTD